MKMPIKVHKKAIGISTWPSSVSLVAQKKRMKIINCGIALFIGATFGVLTIGVMVAGKMDDRAAGASAVRRSRDRYDARSGLLTSRLRPPA
jgi:hypothetical protein